MAAKLTLLRSVDLGLGSTKRSLFYWYTISPRVTDSLAREIVVQNRNKLPNIQVGEVSPLSYLVEADLAALDVGDAGFEIREIVQTGGETLAAFRNRVLADHASRQAAWIAEKRAEYATAGTAVN